MTFINNLPFLFLPMDRKRDWRNRCNIIEWGIEIKHNTHSTQSGGYTQKETTHKWHPSTINSLFHPTNRKRDWRNRGIIIKWSNEIKHNTHWPQSAWWAQKKKNTQKESINNPLFSIVIKSTANSIGEAGESSLNDALKSNVTLAKLNLSCEHAITHKWHPSAIHLFFT